MQIREYNENDIKDMINIWNEVVEEGVAFPQEEFLDAQTGAAFLHRRAIAVLQMMKERLSGYTFCIPTTSADAVIFVMPAMLSAPLLEVGI